MGSAEIKKVALAFSFFASYLFETNRLTTKLLTALPHETLSKEGKTTTLTASLLNYTLLLFMTSVKFLFRSLFYFVPRGPSGCITLMRT